MDNTEVIRERILDLIESEYESDVTFERGFGLAPKTVNNWRRGRSASFMKMLPTIAENFNVNITDLLNMPIRRDTSELSEEELHLLMLYRKARNLPLQLRKALSHTIETTISLYIETAKVNKESSGTRRKSKKSE